MLENSQRGVWSLTDQGRKTEKVDPAAVRKHVREESQAQREARRTLPAEEDEDEVDVDETASTWEEEALAVVKSMEPDAFERLCQRLLRESGFLEVEVTGRSGDGGIDGRGVLRIGGLISFTVMFQSKRYKETVGPSVVRDFRGALMGWASRPSLSRGSKSTLRGFRRSDPKHGPLPGMYLKRLVLVVLQAPKGLYSTAQGKRSTALGFSVT